MGAGDRGCGTVTGAVTGPLRTGSQGGGSRPARDRSPQAPRVITGWARGDLVRLRDRNITRLDPCDDQMQVIKNLLFPFLAGRGSYARKIA